MLQTRTLSMGCGWEGSCVQPRSRASEALVHLIPGAPPCANSRVSCLCPKGEHSVKINIATPAFGKFKLRQFMSAKDLV